MADLGRLAARIRRDTRPRGERASARLWCSTASRSPSWLSSSFEPSARSPVNGVSHRAHVPLSPGLAHLLSGIVPVILFERFGVLF